MLLVILATFGFTSTGWQFLHDAYEIKKEIEAEYQAILGEEEMQHLRTTLNRLIEQQEIIS